MTSSSTDDATTAVALSARFVAERPLSRTQELIWASQRLAADSPLANMGTAHRIAGAVDPDRFVAAVDAVVAASDALRTVIVDRPGHPATARVLARPPRLTEVTELDRAQFDTWSARRISTPIDIGTCGYDSVLIRHDDDDWTWWLDLHHLVTDAFASSLVFDTVASAYESGDVPGDALVGFFDHVGESVASVDDPQRRRRSAFWAEQRSDEPPITPYGPRGPRTNAVTRCSVDLPTGIDASLQGPYRTLSPELSRLALLSLTTATLLHRLDGRDTVTLGIPIHHRSGPDAPRVIGPLMELYPLRLELDGADSFADGFRTVYQRIVDVLRNAKPGESPDSGFDAVVNVLTARYDEFAGMPCTASWMRSGEVEAAHALRVQAYDYGDGLRVELDVNDALSADGSHHRVPGHFGRILDAAVTDPESTLGGFDLLSDEEWSTIATLNPAATDDSPLRPVHVQIARELRADPDRIVAEHGDRRLTAGELDRRATMLARRLIDGGAGPGRRIGVRMHRSLDVLVAIHGVLRSGAAFVLLDPDDPESRHEAIADDAELVALLDELPDELTDPPTESTAGELDPVEPGLDDLAYVLYTSGSTGVPKGVPISHRGLADYLRFAADAYRPTGPMVMALHSSLVFDLTITSLFLPQLLGGRTVVVDGDPLSALAELAAHADVTVLKATPSQLELLTRMIETPRPYEIVIVGGEAFRRPVASAFAERCRDGVRIFNEYGPTEAVVGCMIHEWNPDRDTEPDIPIGVACPGAEAHVLDRWGRRSVVGAWGELYVRRPGMATGYLNLPDLSAERFAPVAGIDDAPIYRTGDRVRVHDGVLVYGGREDDQMKVSGVRLEPGEIETALVAHPDVTNAVVRVWTPAAARIERCIRCGLGTDVPHLVLDDELVCSVCRQYELVEPQTRSWFRTPDDLDAALVRARARTRGDIDCLHLLSGGKDSTYALYQLVERGWRVHALTLDNGYISDGAKANIARSIEDLGISHEFATTDAMADIFRDSLDRYANVCNGCYKTIYTLATARAHELGIPVIVTGLSRGQFFETRLVPHQFEADRFDPDAIDRTVLEARRAYHHTSDAVTTLLPEQQVFERDDIDVLTEIEYVDFYRYVDVELADMYDFLERRAPWVRPTDTGRSTNCLINVAGIHVHRSERGYHNYAEPYSWDVRLGHKTRDEALDELDDEVDLVEIERMLDEIGYVPKQVETLTAWYQTTDGQPLDAVSLKAFVRERLPTRAVPGAYVHVADLPLAGSAKLDVAALPAPSRHHGAVGSEYAAPTTPTEAEAANVWARILDVDRVGRDDDFFDLGGASLLALEVVAALERRTGVDLPDALVFQHRVLHEFAAAVDRAVVGGTSIEPIPPLDPALPAPLTAGEETLLFEHRAAPEHLRYNGTRRYSIPGDVDLDRLHDAIRTVVGRHGPLHTAFDAARTVLPIDLALSFGTLPTADVEAYADAQQRVLFDLDHGPLVRVHAGADGFGTTHVVVAIHHLSVDAGAFDLFWQEVEAAYHGRPLRELETTVAAHGAWQRNRTDVAAAYWVTAADRTDGRSEVGLPPPPRPEPDGYIETVASVTTSELTAAAATTAFAASLAAAGMVLGAHSRTGRVELGITASTKDHPAAEPLIGSFVNPLPLAFDVDPAATPRALDAVTSALIAEALPHRSLPLAEIIRHVRATGGTPPDVSYMLAYEQHAPARWGDTDADLRIVGSAGAVAEVTFMVKEFGETLRLGLEYRGTAIGSHTATQLLTAFTDAIEAICRRPHLPIADACATLAGIDLTGPELPAWSPPLVIERFVEHATRRPDDIAMIDPGGVSVRYGDLHDRATRLAGRLDATAPGHRVGIAVRRSAAMIEAIIAVQLRRAAYVPIDPDSPRHRIDLIVELGGLDAIVVDTTTGVMFADAGLPLVDVDRPGDAGDTGMTDGTSPFRQLPDADDEAYVIFTSGSTGVPAGVPVTHGNLAASTAARSVVYDDEPERFLLTSSIGFDSSLVGLAWPLATGGTVVIPGDDDVHDVDRLGELIDARDVTHVLMVPSLYRALLDRHADRLARLRVAIVAGEACPPGLVRRHAAVLPETELVNEYGPTEATVWATAHRCAPDDDPVPIGRPIPGVTCRIADDGGRAVAAGAPGELLVAGPGVTGGYLDGRSNDRFVELDGRRWYRTGDLVRLDTDERLIFLGRVDDQLNVGGVRIEPADVEAHLTALPGIAEAVLVARTAAGRDVLVAHVVGDRTRSDEATVRAALADRLAGGAVPRYIVFHDDLPRTSHGKIDRQRAAELPIATPTGVGSSALGPIVEIWRSVLGRPELDADADFFALGGDSIAAVEIVTRLARLAGSDVPVAALLHAPTPAAMSEHLGLEAGPGTTPQRRASAQLLTLRPGAPGGPLVVLTASWDDVQGYRALADSFASDITVVAIAVVGQSPGDLDTVPEVVSEAKRLLAELLPWPGPIAIIGWSVGGLVAFELGQQLAHQGIRIAQVGLVDTYFPGEQRHLWANRWSKYKSMLRPGRFGAALGEFRVTARRRTRRLVGGLGRRLLAWAGETVPAPPRDTSPGGIPYAAFEHDPTPGPAPVVLYAARTTNPNRTVRPWRRVDPDLRIVPVDGRHNGIDSIMRVERVRQMSSDIESVLGASPR